MAGFELAVVLVFYFPLDPILTGYLILNESKIKDFVICLVHSDINVKYGFRIREILLLEQIHFNVFVSFLVC